MGSDYRRMDQTGFATDVMDISTPTLFRVYPALVQHDIQHLGTPVHPRVRRFPGPNIPANAWVHRFYKGEWETF